MSGMALEVVGLLLRKPLLLLSDDWMTGVLNSIASGISPASDVGLVVDNILKMKEIASFDPTKKKKQAQDQADDFIAVGDGVESSYLDLVKDDIFISETTIRYSNNHKREET
ncbi:hypothetical protein Q3G72_026993 [Acer saccharum]|nr:hypothetical protein Q3G72_026993 [Acer saccharum]